MTSNLNVNPSQSTPISKFEWQIDEETGDVTIIKFLDKEATVCVVPKEIEKHTVTQIADSAFYQHKKLKSVELPEGLQKIGHLAFANCRSLTTLVLPAEANLESVGYHAFGGCRSLESVKLPQKLEEIGPYAFTDCRSLTKLDLPESLQTIGQAAFSYCSSLAQFTISPNSTRFKLDDGVLFSQDSKTLLAYFENLRQDDEKENYVVPDEVEKLGEAAFCGSQSLTSVVLPNDLKTIERLAFKSCKALTSIAFPNNLQTIGQAAFESCTALTSIVLPEGLGKISPFAFAACCSLNSVNLPNSLQRVGMSTFSKCAPNLTLYGAAGSVAEKYAHENQLRFEAR